MLAYGCMKLKNMLLLGGVLAGAAYLQNKSRRERVFGQARGLMDQAKTRASDLAHKVENRAREVADRVGTSTASTESSGTSSYGAGATTRGDNGLGSSGGYGGVGGSGGLGGSGNYRG